MTLGLYKNFPQGIHRIDIFTSILSSKQLEQKIIEVFCAVNQREFSFEEVANPTVPGGRVIFEFGLADDDVFSFIDQEEVAKALDCLGKERLRSLDFFCAIRYYKGEREKKKALKFDYYLLRTIFSKETFEVQVFHERGPRYISPEELTQFVFNKINEDSKKKILKQTNP